jgi:hypothetical protein
MVHTCILNVYFEFQSQFNTYVFFLRDQYSTKVKTFKQVIDVHRLDLQSKEEYWNEMLQVYIRKVIGIYQRKYKNISPHSYFIDENCERKGK